MEKLLRDLNIYAHSFMNCNLTFTYDGNRIRVQWDEIWPYVAESIILNKKFWFIKWLVENDKIDKKKIDTRLVRNVENHYDEEWYWVENSYEDYSYTDTLLMLLSISDTPIEDLISYLK